MHYVKQFNINGVDTKQVACIELQGKPNAATEGAVGLLGVDILSPLHEVYKCVAVNGSIYTWELLSSGLSTLASTISGEGEETFQFPHDTLKIPQGYLLKKGDLIIDSEGYLYQISAIDLNSCSANYCGTAFTKGADGNPGLTPYIGANGTWWIGEEDTGVIARTGLVTGTFNVIVADATDYSSTLAVSIALDFTPKLIVAVRKDGEEGLCVWSGGRFQFASPSHWRNEVAPFVGGEITAQWDTTENGTFNGEWSYVAEG